MSVATEEAGEVKKNIEQMLDLFFAIDPQGYFKPITNNAESITYKIHHNYEITSSSTVFMLENKRLRMCFHWLLCFIFHFT